MNNNGDFSVAMRSKARCPSLAGIVGSNLAGGIDIYISCECCVLSGSGLGEWADHSCRGVLPSVIVKTRQ
jgi:hypothetical protein